MGRPGYPKDLREFRPQVATHAACVDDWGRCRGTDGVVGPPCSGKSAWLNSTRYVGVPFMRASDVASRGHAPASRARSGAGVAWGGLLRGHAYARNQRTPTPATTWDRQLPRRGASSASTAPGHAHRRPHASVRVDRDGRNAYRWTLERQDGSGGCGCHAHDPGGWRGRRSPIEGG